MSILQIAVRKTDSVEPTVRELCVSKITSFEDGVSEVATFELGIKCVEVFEMPISPIFANYFPVGYRNPIELRNIGNGVVGWGTSFALIDLLSTAFTHDAH